MEESNDMRHPHGIKEEHVSSHDYKCANEISPEKKLIFLIFSEFVVFELDSTYQI